MQVEVPSDRPNGGRVSGHTGRSPVEIKGNMANGGTPKTPIHFQQQWLAEAEKLGEADDESPEFRRPAATPAAPALSSGEQSRGKRHWNRVRSAVRSGSASSKKKDPWLHLWLRGRAVKVYKDTRSSKIGLTLDGWSGPPKIKAIAP